MPRKLNPAPHEKPSASHRPSSHLKCPRNTMPTTWFYHSRPSNGPSRVVVVKCCIFVGHCALSELPSPQTRLYHPPPHIPTLHTRTKGLPPQSVNTSISYLNENALFCFGFGCGCGVAFVSTLFIGTPSSSMNSCDTPDSAPAIVLLCCFLASFLPSRPVKHSMKLVNMPHMLKGMVVCVGFCCCAFRIVW